MKLRLTGEKKAEDESVALQSVPFDGSRLDVVEKALLSLGPTIEDVAKIVKLIRRTNQAIYFDIAASDNVLKPFFAKYYNHMTFDAVKAEYGTAGKETPEEKRQREKKRAAAKKGDEAELNKIKQATPGVEADESKKAEQTKLDNAANRKKYEESQSKKDDELEVQSDDEIFKESLANFFKDSYEYRLMFKN